MLSTQSQAKLIFERRSLVSAGLILVLLGLLLARFVWLQVIQHDSYWDKAEDNRIALVPVPAARGVIFSREGEVLADNTPAYNLEITPAQTESIDQTLDVIEQIIEISPKDKRRFRQLLKESRSLDSLPLKVRLSDEEVARISANRYRLPGVEIKARLYRSYPHASLMAHVVGYIGRISKSEKRQLEDRDDSLNYAGSTHVGKTGLERSYQHQLHGQTGFDRVEVTAGGRISRELERIAPSAGMNLHLSLSVGLQQVASEAFGERRGALVAIEPSSGDVLAFVSRPDFDPNLFIDGIDPQSWNGLNQDPDLPLLNRALRGTYPPGSTYKPFVALAALQSGKRNPGQHYRDPGYFELGGHRFRDSRPEGHGSVDLKKSIVVSSDTYYYQLAHEMGPDLIADYVRQWGFGEPTRIDLEGEASGVLPTTKWKLKRFKQRWLPGESPSIGIGQGYNLANHGKVMKPRLVRRMVDPSNAKDQRIEPEVLHETAVNPAHLELVIAAMQDVNLMGTAQSVFARSGYSSAGKTGTSQVIGIKQNERYDAKRIAERHRDHSLYVAFAPVEAPRIALAVIVENGGFGAQAAAPIARKVLDHHLLSQRGQR
ncbi:MAG: penicillin-binding protein 2 [Betaproteobacteria bacterium]|nr:penicillin-binding protein 2 [Betaproteobacteria bacterium]